MSPYKVKSEELRVKNNGINFSLFLDALAPRRECSRGAFFTFHLRSSGGYSGGVPPLPIPNREVKPARADGTAHPWESR